ncbi:hypothetical protein Ae201684P_005182 [Aphanomyces euteiches]|nr:hypothetical protein Ae201684P_005182 [Aphanomyces euteiches]KAH9154758.1 hypothetical protein AeRB84_003201 [Aphanomyces euteiches]
MSGDSPWGPITNSGCNVIAHVEESTLVPCDLLLFPVMAKPDELCKRGAPVVLSPPTYFDLGGAPIGVHDGVVDLVLPSAFLPPLFPKFAGLRPWLRVLYLLRLSGEWL